MSLRIARETVLQQEFDSGSLTPLCTVIHHVEETGLYIGEVAHGESVVGTFRVQAVGDGADRQATIDLATVRGTATAARLVLAPGSIVLHTSVGTIGYSVRLWRSGDQGREPEFDSQDLGADDLFAVTLLYPGDWEVVDEDDRPLCRLSVEACEPDDRPYRPPAPAVSELTDEALESAGSAQLHQAQTQVFRAGGRSRIRVRPAEPERAALERPEGKVEWRREEK